MRLIDADELIRNILSQTIMNETDAKIMDRYSYCINNQPTVYDVDKVIEGITKLQKESYSYAFKYNDEFYDGQADGLKKALDIINKHLK